MKAAGDYELLDFGAGRKLERFGPWTIDRPCPAADDAKRAAPDHWRCAHARFERSDEDRGAWQRLGETTLPESWSIDIAGLRFELKLTPFGHVGLFPEQQQHWSWLQSRIAAAGRPLSVLNLFAYTGGSTLAATAAGAQVAHVDASKPVVAWARRNADLSELADGAVRWIVEDAPRFVTRELRRGRRYDALVLDPPSYGHGPAGETWQVERCLPGLLEQCAVLTADSCALVLLTCHTPGYDAARLAELAAPWLKGGVSESGQMALETSDGRHLPSGSFFRWSAG